MKYVNILKLLGECKRNIYCKKINRKIATKKQNNKKIGANWLSFLTLERSIKDKKISICGQCL